jgi:hypothetical protein
MNNKGEYDTAPPQRVDRPPALTLGIMLAQGSAVVLLLVALAGVVIALN